MSIDRNNSFLNQNDWSSRAIQGCSIEGVINRQILVKRLQECLINGIRRRVISLALQLSGEFVLPVSVSLVSVEGCSICLSNLRISELSLNESHGDVRACRFHG